MLDEEYPRVFFRTRRNANAEFKFGYLSIIDGIPWVAPSLTEAQSKIPLTMLRLEPEHLEEHDDDATGERYFLYRVVLNW